MAEVERFQEVLEEQREQAKTIEIQKAKIGALQHELTEALKKINLLEIQVEDRDSGETK